MKNIGAKMVLFVLAGIVIAMPLSVSAQDNPIGKIDPLGEGVGEGDATLAGSIIDANALVTTITTLINWFSWFVALISVVIGLYAGFLFITARGEAAQLKTARATLLWAVIGIAVAIISFSIIVLTKTIFDL